MCGFRSQKYQSWIPDFGSSSKIDHHFSQVRLLSQLDPINCNTSSQLIIVKVTNKIQNNGFLFQNNLSEQRK